MLRVAFCVVGLSLVSMSSAKAAFIVSNQFNTPTVPTGEPGFLVLDTGADLGNGFSVTAGTVDLIRPGLFGPTPNNDQALDLNGNGPGTISVTVATVVGQLYAIDFVRA